MIRFLAKFIGLCTHDTVIQKKRGNVWLWECLDCPKSWKRLI